MLELGAGAGLPSIICAALGAASVVVTDYPDAHVIANMQHNVEAADAVLDANGALSARIAVRGYAWGGPAAALLSILGPEQRFAVVVLADLLFRHSGHADMLRTLRQTLARDGVAYVFFTSYRPWLRHKDLAFFDLAAMDEHGPFAVEQVMEHKLDKPMFDGDPGDVEVQKTVTGWTLRWKDP